MARRRATTTPCNYIVPATGLSELLNRNGVRDQLGPNDVIYRQGLADYFSGHYTRAIENFGKLLAVSPNQPQALQYRTQAVKARDQFGDHGLSALQWMPTGLMPGPVPSGTAPDLPVSGWVPTGVPPTTNANVEPAPVLNESPTARFCPDCGFPQG